MDPERLNPHAVIPCPQCSARGEVPGTAGSRVGYVTCPLCEGKGEATVEQVVASGWPPEVLAERHPQIAAKVSNALLME